MQMITLPVKGFWVICRDKDIEELYDANDFDEADNRLNQLRKEFPDYEAEMTADIDA